MPQRDFFPRINRSHPLANGLVFAGLGGGASTLLYADASGYGNHGTLTNMDPPTDWVWSNELNRWYTDFDATDDYVDLQYNITSAPLTISAFVSSVYTGVSAGYGNHVFRSKAGWSTFCTSYTGGSSKGPLIILGDAGSGYQYFDSSVKTIAADGKWHHWAWTVFSASDRNTWFCYLDGKSLSRDSTGGSLGAFTLGRLGKAPAYPSAIKLSNLMVHNRVISESEIQQLADPSNVMLSGLILPPRRRLFPASGNRNRRFLISCAR